MLSISRRLFGPVFAALCVSIVCVVSAKAGEDILATIPSHGERSMGSPDSPVVLIEYASATCPHCAEFHVNVLPAIKEEFVDTGKVRFVFREFPLDDVAMGAFMLARCVPEDKYFETIDIIFQRQQEWRQKPKDGLFDIVKSMGLAEQDAEDCLKNRDLAKAIFDTGKTANEKFGVDSTPTFFVNGEKVDGHKDITALRSAIERALASPQ